MPFRIIREFIRLESASGILLCLTALLGLIVANTPLHMYYQNILYHPIISHFSLNYFINAVLMALFFFLVSLEIKREIIVGELNSLRKIALPGIAAIAGMVFPALIYLMFNGHDKNLLRGWAIPTATDIAFALGVLTLLGKRIPLSVKIFLTALAIFDDLGAIIIIAFFYTQMLHWYYLLFAALTVVLLGLLNSFQVKKFWPYLLFGILLWFCIFQSGIHPTIAGVLLAFTIPLDKQQPSQYSLLRHIEHYLHPWVAYLILPLFAFANTGIPFQDFQLSLLLTSVPLGIGLGLFFGKQLGVFLAVYAAVKCGWAELPTNCNWQMLYGTALLCGIGFTMSLFIGGLAFTETTTLNLVRAGVLAGSLISGFCGYVILRRAARG